MCVHETEWTINSESYVKTTSGAKETTRQGSRGTGLDEGVIVLNLRRTLPVWYFYRPPWGHLSLVVETPTDEGARVGTLNKY